MNGLAGGLEPLAGCPAFTLAAPNPIIPVGYLSSSVLVAHGRSGLAAGTMVHLMFGTGVLADSARIGLTLSFALIPTLVILVSVSRQVRGLVMARDEPGRGLLVASALALWATAFALFWLLVFDKQDNAYLLVGFLGLLLVPTGIVFWVAAALPSGRWLRRGAVAAVGLLWGVGLYGVVGMAASIAIIPSQNYQGNDVLLSHVLALLLMVGLLLSALFAFRRQAGGHVGLHGSL